MVNGHCSGIENYSRYFDGRQAGERPYCLLDFFPDDYLTVIDESHVSVPQIGAMYGGDRARKTNLVEYGFRLMVGAEPIEVRLSQLVEPFYLRYWENTTPLWFLLSLFWVNVIFYAMQRWIKPLWGILLATVALSVVGYELGVNKIELPLMLDTSLVALPYFVLGWGINRIGAIAPTKWDRWGVLALIAVAMPIYWLSDFMNLHFQVLPSYWKLYVLPFVAILALFWACKPLPHIPLFCYYGRYSLIILGTHPLILQPVRFLLLRQGMESGLELTLFVFVVTMLVELPLIWLLKTWAPRFTAQEPFFKPGWKLR